MESTCVHPAGALYVLAAPVELPLFQNATTTVWPAAGVLGNDTVIDDGAKALPVVD